ncbi:hypothetical protein Tbd_2573 [Thiobacillus denitrificans ATCC 25259]|uniref:Uncharacterized protein n=1 Tax=Thiobacillus denitrificans (strain ATCC 25259 / T1) TaxID=292415 RepID=Q3SFT0_THIDA|nr:hypothetical protein Tbd_2573 [Thiobacillus denitrificans ATCC 25259]
MLFGGAVRGEKSKPVLRLARRRALGSSPTHKRPVRRRPGFDLCPLQTRRKSRLPGGSAAKVFEPRPLSKYKSKRGEFFAAHPAASVFGNSGLAGSHFLWLLSFGETKESD